MKVFVAASYSGKVNYVSGEVYDEYREWMEALLESIEAEGHTVFNALRASDYKISTDAAAAARLDLENIRWCDVLVAITEEELSAGTQTEIGYALGRDKRVVIAHPSEVKPAWFNQALDKADLVEIVGQPLDPKVI